MVQEQAYNELLKIDTIAVTPLIDALRDESHFLREAAAYSLGEIEDIRVITSLIAALEDYSQRNETNVPYALMKWENL